MLTRVDRVQVLVPDRAPVVDRWVALLGGEPAHEDAIDSMFLHPDALGGMMLGISRQTQAWSWSGRPDWVKEATR